MKIFEWIVALLCWCGLGLVAYLKYTKGEPFSPIMVGVPIGTLIVISISQLAKEIEDGKTKVGTKTLRS